MKVRSWSVARGEGVGVRGYQEQQHIEHMRACLCAQVWVCVCACVLACMYSTDTHRSN